MDEGVAKEVARMRVAGAGGKPGRRAGLSRAAKRKVVGGESEEESEGFEEMVVDKGENAEEDDEEIREVVTPERSEHETTSEEEPPLPPSKRKAVRGTIGGKGSVVREVGGENGNQESGVSNRTRGKSNESEAVEAPPPRRELPFTRKNTAGAGQVENEKQEQLASMMDDETEDEL